MTQISSCFSPACNLSMAPRHSLEQRIILYTIQRHLLYLPAFSIALILHPPLAPTPKNYILAISQKHPLFTPEPWHMHDPLPRAFPAPWLGNHHLTTDLWVIWPLYHSGRFPTQSRCKTKDWALEDYESCPPAVAGGGNMGDGGCSVPYNPLFAIPKSKMIWEFKGFPHISWQQTWPEITWGYF